MIEEPTPTVRDSLRGEAQKPSTTATTRLRSTYCFTAPAAPVVQPGQMPNPVPLAMMNPQSVVIRASSAALNVAGTKAVSVVAKVPGAFDPPAGAAWMFVPNAIKPGRRPPGVLGSQVDAPPVVDRIFTVIDVGTAGVSVLLINWRADVVTTPFGVTMQKQHATSCSSGENT